MLRYRPFKLLLDALSHTQPPSGEISSSNSFAEHRCILFIALAGSGYIPMLHQYLLFGIDGLRSFPLTSALLMDAIYLLGVGFYVTQFPERRFPKRFDIWVSDE